MEREIKFLTTKVMMRDIPIGGYFYKHFLYKKLKNSSHNALLNNHYGCLYAVNLDTNEIVEFDELTFVTPLKKDSKEFYSEDYNFIKEVNNNYNYNLFNSKKLEKILINKKGEVVGRSELSQIVSFIVKGCYIYNYKTKVELQDLVLFIFVED